jgi:hypothetical protein
MLNVALAPSTLGFTPQTASPVWVTWAEGFAGRLTLAPRGEYRRFLVFTQADSPFNAAEKAQQTLQDLGWERVFTQAGPRFDPERLHSLPEEFHEICEAAMGGQTGIMHYRVSRRLRPQLFPAI